MKDDWLAIDVRIKAVAMAMMILSLASPAVHGDFATPFVEINNKVGDVSKAHCYIVAISQDFFPVHLVIVGTDTLEHVVIKATVAREIVKRDLLGRPVIIKAQTVAPTRSNYHTTLKILSMEPWGRPKDAGIAEERSEQPLSPPVARVTVNRGEQRTVEIVSDNNPENPPPLAAEAAGAAAAVTSSVSKLENADPLVRRMRVYDLANQKDKSAAKAFLDLFDDVDSDVQEAAIARIGDLDDPIAIPHLAQIMRTSGAAHQEAAMISLQELSYSYRDNNLLIETTLDALSSGNSEIRHRAAQVLGHINTYDVGTGVCTPDPRVVEPLVRALKDPDHRVVGAAATSLGSQNLTQESASIFDSLMKCQAAWKSIRAAGYKDNPSDENSAKERIEEYFALKQAGACCLDALVRMDAKQFGPRLASMSPEVLVIIDGPTRWQRSLTRALDVLVTDKEPELVKQIEYMKAAIAEHQAIMQEITVKSPEQEGLRNTTK